MEHIVNEVLMRKKNKFCIDNYINITGTDLYKYDLYKYISNVDLNEQPEDMMADIKQIINNHNIKLDFIDIYDYMFSDKEIIYENIINDYADKKTQYNKTIELLNQYGYTLSQDFKCLMFCNMSALQEDLISIIKKLNGIYDNSIVLNGIQKNIDIDNNELNIINIGTKEDYMQIIQNLVYSKIALSNQDKTDIENSLQIFNINLDKQIENKENLVFITNLYMNNNLSFENLFKQYRTPMDVYRLMASMSNQDISLSEKIKFRCFKRKEQRCLLMLLNNIVKNKSALDDMYKNRNVWINALFPLNPGRYKKYTEIYKIANILRDGKKLDTFTGKVNQYLNEGKYIEAIDLLKNKPGEFARRLNELINKADIQENEINYIMNTYKNIVYDISNNVLISIIEFFKNYNMNNFRVFNIKSTINKKYCKLNDCHNIKTKFIDFIIKSSENALIYNNSKKDYMGNVYLSNDFKNYAIPNGLRMSNGGTKIFTRGSKEDFNLNKLKLFIHWTNMINKKANIENRVDVDLSCIIMDETFTCIEYCDFTSLKSPCMQHSGDITDGGPYDGAGVMEYLNIDIDKVRQNADARYILPMIYNFTHFNFSDIPCTFGYMNNFNNDIDVKSVKNVMNITVEAPNSTPFVIDLYENKIIYLDINIGKSSDDNHCYDIIKSNKPHKNSQSVAGTMNMVQRELYNILNINHMNMYDLIKYNITSRGTETDDIQNADYIFTNDINIENINNINKNRDKLGLTEVKIISAFDIDEIINDLM